MLRIGWWVSRQLFSRGLKRARAEGPVVLGRFWSGFGGRRGDKKVKRDG